jgi:DNA-binding CsgD family transcriptional regulator
LGFGFSLPSDTNDLPALHADLSELTPGEFEVLQLMARGLSNAELVAQFYLSEATVKAQVGRILAKLGLRDRVQAVVLAHEIGLAGPGPAGRPESHPLVLGFRQIGY